MSRYLAVVIFGATIAFCVAAPYAHVLSAAFARPTKLLSEVGR